MINEEINKLSDILLQSLYDYHFANNGGSYTLPKAMVNADSIANKLLNTLSKRNMPKIVGKDQIT